MRRSRHTYLLYVKLYKRRKKEFFIKELLLTTSSLSFILYILYIYTSCLLLYYRHFVQTHTSILLTAYKLFVVAAAVVVLTISYFVYKCMLSSFIPASQKKNRPPYNIFAHRTRIQTIFHHKHTHTKCHPFIYPSTHKKKKL